MMRPLLLLLVLLLIASPALADPLLSGTWDSLLGGQLTFVNLTFAQFTAHADNDGHASGVFQGVMYCEDEGFACDSPGHLGTINVNYFFGLTTVPDCAVPPFYIANCPDGVYPVSLMGGVTFYALDQTAIVGGGGFSATGDGTNRHGIGLTHADFGSSIPTPEPATWLLLLTGMIIIGLTSVCRSRV